MARQQGCGLFARDECRMLQHRNQVGQVGLDAVDACLVERSREIGDGEFAIRAARDDFREHGIVVGGDFGARLDPAVDAQVFRSDPQVV